MPVDNLGDDSGGFVFLRFLAYFSSIAATNSSASREAAMSMWSWLSVLGLIIGSSIARAYGNKKDREIRQK